MKGVIFTGFLDLVDDKFGAHTTEEIINKAELPSGGAYTAVGTYDHSEMFKLVSLLSESTGIDVPDLLTVFGRFLFGHLIKNYPHVVEGIDDCLDFIEVLERVIHPEVLKLYPNAELPSFKATRIAPDQLELIYNSPRCLAGVAEGLIQGCADHFNQQATITTEALPGPAGSAVKFHIQCVNAVVPA